MPKPYQTSYSAVLGHVMKRQNLTMYNKNNQKIASLGRQEPKPAGTAKWPTTLRFGKILGTTSVVKV